MSNPSSPAPVVEEVGLDPLALVSACVLPGLGHVVRGERVRGACVCAGVLGLFGTGMLVGGIDVVDRREDTAYFIGQACVGPLAFVVDHIHQTRFKVLHERRVDGRIVRVLESGFPGEMRAADGVGVMPDDSGKLPAAGEPYTRPAIKSISKMNELGMLFGAIAGMVNVIAVIDAGFPTRRRRGAAA